LYVISASEHAAVQPVAGSARWGRRPSYTAVTTGAHRQHQSALGACMSLHYITLELFRVAWIQDC